MPVLVQMVSHDPKSHVAPHFDHLDLRNAMVALMELSTSHDATPVQWHHVTPMLMASFDQKGMFHLVSYA